MAKLFTKSRLEPYEWVEGLIVAVDDVTEDGFVHVKVTSDKFQIILHMHESEFRKLFEQYEIIKDMKKSRERLRCNY